MDNSWFNRGLLWKAKENLRQAEADFTQAIACNVRFAHAYAHRGIVRLLRRGDFQNRLHQALWSVNSGRGVAGL